MTRAINNTAAQNQNYILYRTTTFAYALDADRKYPIGSIYTPAATWSVSA